MFKRFRHTRVDEQTRARYREITLSAADLIMPLFIVEGGGHEREIKSLPGVFHYPVDVLEAALAPLVHAGLQSVILFPVPKNKVLTDSYSESGLVQRATRMLKQVFPELQVISDVCLCSYTKDGHCHIGDNDSSCELLAQIAVSHACAGVDIVAPSDMMDGRVWHIKSALQAAGLDTPIMSYAAKYASNFYGPFRTASDCALQAGDDRRTYQMDYCNSNQALEEIAADIDEGASSIIVKPALAYLDIVSRARARFKLPIVAYNVSGEYMMLRNAVQQGLLDSDAINESLIAIKRAGADRIISYFAREWLLTHFG